MIKHVLIRMPQVKPAMASFWNKAEHNMPESLIGRFSRLVPYDM